MDYYHLKVEIKDKYTQKPRILFVLDLKKDDLIKDYVLPYCNNKYLIIDGREINKNDISQFKITKTNNISKIIHAMVQHKFKGAIFAISDGDAVMDKDYSSDVTSSVLSEYKTNTNSKFSVEVEKLNRVFIVYGHNNEKLVEVENFVRTIGLEPVVLSKQPDTSRTIIEKIEEEVKKCVYGIIIYTKCDKGCKFNDEKNIKPRARQNVVFEHGFLIASLGRERTTALKDGNEIETPSDIGGVIYTLFDEQSEWKYSIIRNMKKIGIDVDANKII